MSRSDQDVRFLHAADDFDHDRFLTADLHPSQEGANSREDTAEGRHLDGAEWDKPQPLRQSCRNDSHVRRRIKLRGQVRDRGGAIKPLKRNVDKRSGRTELLIIAIADHESVRFRRGVGIRTTGWGASDTRPT